MTLDEIRAAIAASAELQALVPDTVALAGALSVGRKEFVPTEIGKGTIIETLGLGVANGLIDAVLATADYRHVKELLEQGRLRLDIVAHAGMLQPLVSGGVLTQPQLDALVARAQVDEPIPEFDVRRAIYADDGSLLV